MPKFEVRRATADDLPRLGELWTAQRDIETQLDPRLQLIGPVRPKVFQTLPEAEQVLVALREGTLLGFVWVARQEDTTPETGIIRALVVDAHDGQGGVGTALLDAATDWLREMQVEHLIIDDVPRHVAVQHAFWRAKGAGVIRETLYLPIRMPEPTDDEDGA